MSDDRRPVREYASAFVVATVAALVVDAALQLSLDAVRVSAYGGGAPWWVTAHVIERGRWVVLALLLWWGGPRLLQGEAGAASPLDGVTHRDAWRQVAIAVVAVPLLWVVATWAVSSVRFTLSGSWDTDGRVFVSADYYRGLLLDLVPWMLAGAVTAAVRRHVR